MNGKYRVVTTPTSTVSNCTLIHFRLARVADCRYKRRWRIGIRNTRANVTQQRINVGLPAIYYGIAEL